MLRHRRPDGGNTADDLMAGHAGVHGIAPLVFGLVDVGVTDAAEQNVNFNLVRLGVFAFKFEWLEPAEGVLAA